jgi:hypothetical protein
VLPLLGKVAKNALMKDRAQREKRRNEIMVRNVSVFYFLGHLLHHEQLNVEEDI